MTTVTTTARATLPLPGALPLPLARTAFFFDFDGTLVELAATPDSVRVRPDMLALLRALRVLTQGAVAIVSGRGIERIDAFLGMPDLPVAGLHGAERRNARGAVQRIGFDDDRDDRDAHVGHDARDDCNAHVRHDARDDCNAHVRHDAHDDGDAHIGHDARDDRNAHVKHDARDDRDAHVGHDARDDCNAHVGHDARDDRDVYIRHDARDDCNAHVRLGAHDGCDVHIGHDARATHDKRSAPLRHMRQSLEEVARAHPGMLLEDKGVALALHYRNAPECEPVARAAVMKLAAAHHDAYAMQPGKMVYEIRPRHVDKGRAVRAFLDEPPFAGRYPVFAGDDLTDEKGFAVVNAHGGLSVKVESAVESCEAKSRNTLAVARVESVDALLAWLARLVGAESQENQGSRENQTGGA